MSESSQVKGVPREIQDLGTRLSQAVQAEIPEGTFVLICAFIPVEDEPNNFVSILRVNVEDPTILFRETLGMIERAKQAEVLDLRTVGGMQ